MSTVIFGEHDEGTLDQFGDVAQGAVHSALLPDGHKAYVMPVGGVAAYRDRVSVAGVGVDIGCGNDAVETSVMRSDLTDGDLAALADRIQREISFGVGRKNQADDAPTDHPIFADARWGVLPAAANVHNLIGKARQQLGTVGGGNHYVDVLEDRATGRLWVANHFGSRGMGFTIANGFWSIAQGLAWGGKPPEVEVLLGLNDPLGGAYWAGMQLAGWYAQIGRAWVVDKVAAMLGGTVLGRVANHHNFAWIEQHFGEQLVVVRKGATPAFPGQRGFVGGSMGDDAVVLRGWEGDHPFPGHDDEQTRIDLDNQEAALFSTVHGAGRVLGRAAAKKGRVTAYGRDPVTNQMRATRDQSTIVTRQAMSEWTRARGVVVRGGDVDEAPQCYRRLPDVLAAVEGTVVVEHTLKPVIVVMADERERDPYKD